MSLFDSEIMSNGISLRTPLNRIGTGVNDMGADVNCMFGDSGCCIGVVGEIG